LSCAQIVAPTGGEKDIIPPEILSIDPENNQIQFQETSIRIEFDEFIKLNNLSKQLIVSPPLNHDLNVKVKGKSLQIEIEDTLKENTTYLLNFGNAIVDITEQNPVADFKYVFSTGSHIDSLSISGQVIDAFKLEAIENMLVMLYEDYQNDSIPLKELPQYLGRTNKEGNYQITNIKAGTYRLFGVKDANDNFIFDRPDEVIAFYGDSLEINDNIDSVKLYSFLEDKQSQYLESQTEKGPQLILDFKKRIDSMNILQIDSVKKANILQQKIGVEGDSLFIWWQEYGMEEINIQLTSDSNFSDTISFKADSMDKKAKLKLNRPVNSIQAHYKPVSLIFNRPIKSIDADSIQLTRIDSTAIKHTISIDSNNNHKALLAFKFKEDSTYRLILHKGAIQDIYGRVNDSLNYKFKFDKPKDYGNLSIKLNADTSCNRIVQLLDKGKKVLRSSSSRMDQQIDFKHLKAGSYRLRLIFDCNNNNRWDTGEYLSKKQAEKTILFNETITIRANWDKEIEWIITD